MFHTGPQALSFVPLGGHGGGGHNGQTRRAQAHSSTSHSWVHAVFLSILPYRLLRAGVPEHNVSGAALHSPPQPLVSADLATPALVPLHKPSDCSQPRAVQLNFWKVVELLGKLLCIPMGVLEGRRLRG